jgi:tetratricopeptide (TPR) repeat protein
MSNKRSTIIIIFLLCVAMRSGAGVGRSSETVMMQDSLVQQASRYFSEGEYKRTIALNDPADSLYTSPKLQYYKGMSCAALYDYPHAIEYFQRAVDGDSANVHYRFQYGRLLIQAGFLDRAAAELSACMKVDSAYLPAWYQLGLLCNMQGNNLKKEYEIFLFLIRHNPDDFVSLYYLGDVLRRYDLPDSGIAFIKRSIAVNPHYYPSLIALGNYFNEKKQFAPALEQYKNALKIRPDDKELLYQTGECLRKTGAPNEAVACFKKAIAIDSTKDKFHAQLGYAYFSLGRFDSSVRAYKNAIALENDNADYYKNIALAYLQMDSVEAAIRMSKKRIEALHPGNISFAYTNLAALYNTKNRSHDAIRMYKNNISAAYLELAAYYHSNTMRSEAIAMYLRVVEFDPSRQDLLIMIARLYEEMNDNKSAIQIYKKMMQSMGGRADEYFQKKIDFLLKNGK